MWALQRQNNGLEVAVLFFLLSVSFRKTLEWKKNKTIQAEANKTATAVAEWKFERSTRLTTKHESDGKMFRLKLNRIIEKGFGFQQSFSRERLDGDLLTGVDVDAVRPRWCRAIACAADMDIN